MATCTVAAVGLTLMARHAASPGRAGRGADLVDLTTGVGPELAGEPVVEIDLRDPAGVAPVAPTQDGPEARLASILDLPGVAAEILLDALLEVADAGGKIGEVVSSASSGHWVQLLDHFAETRGRRSYIGSFRVAIGQAAELCRQVPERERSIAALLLLDRATAEATTEDELRHGVAAAMRVWRGTIVPETAIETIVRIALRHHQPGRELPVELAVPVALDLMAQSTEPCFHPRDIWTLRAAVAVLTHEQRERVLARAQHLRREDRKIVEALIRPARSERSGRIGIFRRRRS